MPRFQWSSLRVIYHSNNFTESSLQTLRHLSGNVWLTVNATVCLNYMWWFHFNIADVSIYCPTYTTINNSCGEISWSLYFFWLCEIVKTWKLQLFIQHRRNKRSVFSEFFRRNRLVLYKVIFFKKSVKTDTFAVLFWYWWYLSFLKIWIITIFFFNYQGRFSVFRYFFSLKLPSA